MEVAAARSSAGNITEERREEFFVPLAPAPPPPAPITTLPVPAPTPVIIDAGPPLRSLSPSATTSTSSYDSRPHHRHHHHHPETSAPIPIGPLALAERSRSRSRHRSRSRSHTNREIRAEIRALERELVHRPKHEIGPISDREVVRAERLPDGQLVIYEEEVEKVVHTHKPARIEKDKKGRLSLSVPRR